MLVLMKNIFRRAKLCNVSATVEPRESSSVMYRTLRVSATMTLLFHHADPETAKAREQFMFVGNSDRLELLPDVL